MRLNRTKVEEFIHVLAHMCQRNKCVLDWRFEVWRPYSRSANNVMIWVEMIFLEVQKTWKLGVCHLRKGTRRRSTRRKAQEDSTEGFIHPPSHIHSPAKRFSSQCLIAVALVILKRRMYSHSRGAEENMESLDGFFRGTAHILGVGIVLK